jgi:hypothetical protein
LTFSDATPHLKPDSEDYLRHLTGEQAQKNHIRKADSAADAASVSKIRQFARPKARHAAHRAKRCAAASEHCCTANKQGNVLKFWGVCPPFSPVHASALGCHTGSEVHS